jgi:ribose transport system permease protein
MNEMKTKSQNPLLTSIVISSRYLSVWVAIGLLLLTCLWIAPETLTRTSFTAVMPLTSFLALTALGQMLVVMTGGIDLSTPGIMTLAALMTVGIAGRSNEQMPIALAIALSVSLLIGMCSGILVGVLKLNPLIVTLAVGQIVNGAMLRYADRVANEASVPAGFSAWITKPFAFGLNNVESTAIGISLLFVLIFRYTEVGRKFQAVGANPTAAWILGLRVNGYVILAYMAAAFLYGLSGVLLAGFLQSPSLVLGVPYLLGPIATVVIGGASLSGGLASAASTWASAFFLTLLSQMLRVLGLPTSLQFVVFGIAIIGGMVISGDRIITLIENFMRNAGRLDDSPQYSNETNVQGGSMPK